MLTDVVVNQAESEVDAGSIVEHRQCSTGQHLARVELTKKILYTR